MRTNAGQIVRENMVLRRCRYRHAGNRQLFFCLIVTTAFLTLVVFMIPTTEIKTHINILLRDQTEADVSLVNWRPSLNDTNVFMLEPGEGNTSSRPLLLVPTPNSGSEFFSSALKTVIKLQGIDVKTIDSMNQDQEASKKDQVKRLNNILRNTSAAQLVLIESNVIDMTVPPSLRLPAPRVVILFRDPVEMVLSSYHQRLYGAPLYAPTLTNMTPGEFRQRLADLISKFQKCVKRNHNCAKGLLGSYFMVKLFSGMPAPSKRGMQHWASQALLAAMSNVDDNGIMIGVMEDFDDLPFMFERMAPKICKHFGRLMAVLNPPLWADELVNISENVQNIIIKRDVQLSLERRFYYWAKSRYYRLKKKSFVKLIQ